MEVEPVRFVPGPERFQGISPQFGNRWHFGEELAVRTPEPEPALRQSLDLEALLVDRAVVPAAEHGEIRQRCRAAVGPVPDVMALAKSHPTARKATAPVTMMQRPPDRRRNGPRARSDLDNPAVPAVAHHHPARVARQALGRSRWNARTVLQD